MKMNWKKGWGIGAIVALCLASCSEEEIEYYPMGKKHLGETYTEYSIANIWSTDSVSRIPLNFYAEEVTSLPYVAYDESACVFTFHRGSTDKYLISWDYDTEGSYVEVQYGQNGLWYTVNAQKHAGTYLLTANDGMGVRMCIQSGGSMILSDDEIKYGIGVTVYKFKIEEAEPESTEEDCYQVSGN